MVLLPILNILSLLYESVQYVWEVDFDEPLLIDKTLEVWYTNTSTLKGGDIIMTDIISFPISGGPDREKLISLFRRKEKIRFWVKHDSGSMTHSKIIVWVKGIIPIERGSEQTFKLRGTVNLEEKEIPFTMEAYDPVNKKGVISFEEKVTYFDLIGRL